MRHLAFTGVFILTAFASLAGGGHTNAQHPSAALTPAPAVLKPVSESRDRVAYELAWRRATATRLHTDALRVADALATAIGLRPGTVRASVERFIDQQMSRCPGCYNEAAATPSTTLYRLIREDVGGFQRALSPLLPEPNYVRYVALLDSLRIRS